MLEVCCVYNSKPVSRAFCQGKKNIFSDCFFLSSLVFTFLQSIYFLKIPFWGLAIVLPGPGKDGGGQPGVPVGGTSHLHRGAR